MEFEQLHGVIETVPEFTYQSWPNHASNKSVRRTYEGHSRIVAAFPHEREATEYANTLRRKKHDRWGGAYMGIQECEYKRDTMATYEVIPIDVMPAVRAREPV